MGNYYGSDDKWGIIHNDTKLTVYFLIHNPQQKPFQEINKKVQSQNNISKQQIIKMILDIENINQVPAKTLGISGLDNLKVNGSERISMIFENGKIFQTAGFINSKNDIRIKITSQLSIRSLNPNQAIRLKIIASSIKKPSKKLCHKCINDKNKSELNIIEQSKGLLKCEKCKSQQSKVLVCQRIFSKHIFCSKCHQDGLLQSKIAQINQSTQNNNPERGSSKSQGLPEIDLGQFVKPIRVNSQKDGSIQWSLAKNQSSKIIKAEQQIKNYQQSDVVIIDIKENEQQE